MNLEKIKNVNMSSAIIGEVIHVDNGVFSLNYSINLI